MCARTIGIIYICISIVEYFYIISHGLIMLAQFILILINYNAIQRLKHQPGFCCYYFQF